MTRLVSGDSTPLEATDKALRPQTLAEFVGQESSKANLRVFINAARDRGEALDHVLLFGPPGLGKTTLAQIIARELGVNFRSTSGPVLAKAGDLAAILTNLEPNDVLFIDEIHRLAANIEEILYPAMEDHALDLVIGEGPSARSIRIDLSPFTLVAATTRAGLLATPLRDRFGNPVRLNFYTPEELQHVLGQAARKKGLSLGPDGAAEIAARARGTPRVAGAPFAPRARLRRRRWNTENRPRLRRPEPCPTGGGRRGAGRAGSALSRGAHRELRRRPRGGRNSGLRHRRGTGLRRGRHRTLSAPARLHPANAPGAAGLRQGLFASRSHRADGGQNPATPFR